MKQKIRLFETPSSKKIFVIDNAFSFQEREHFFNFIKQSFFVFSGFSDSNEFKKRDHGKPFLQSFFNKEDVNQFNFLSCEGSNFFLNILQDYHFIRSYVFVSDHSIQHSYHCDFIDHSTKLRGNHLTLLYYPNLEWDNSFGGETLFANDQINDVVFTSMYVPGRVIIFDSSIPHKMSAPSTSCPFYRFTYVMNWRKNETHNGNEFPIKANKRTRG